jgi:NADH-quinone oxidoreductase subunit I
VDTELKMPQTRIAKVIEGIKGLADAYRITLRHLFRKPITEEYPEFKRALPLRTRGRIILTRSPDGQERCVACYLCSAVCPVSCISMEAAESEDGRRFAPWFRINFARCIYCGLCEEACPTLALQLTPEFAFCRTDILELVYEKEDLLVDHGGKNEEYDFYKVCGIGGNSEKGTHDKELGPVDIRSNMP